MTNRSRRCLTHRHAAALVALLAAVVLLIGIAGPASAAKIVPVSPVLTPWMDALPIPPVAVPGVNAAYPGADYYEITMTQHTHQFHSQLGLATVRTYGQNGGPSVYLGPTIVAQTGKPAVIKWMNQLPTNNFPLPGAIDTTLPGGDLPTGRAVPHLHGGFTASAYDGIPDQWWTADGQTGMDYVTDTYVYTNEQPASLVWYHDHAMGITRHNPYLGLAAAYLVTDNVDNAVTVNGQNVPTGVYHVPLVLQDKSFNANGTLFYPTVGITPVHPVWVPEFFGDVPVINGKAFPFLNVEPRRYRFRMINGSQARFFNLQFKGNGGPLPLYVIGSDGGLLPAPAALTQLLVAPGERYDVIVDFTGLKLGSVLTVTNNAGAPYPMGGGGVNLPDLMQIRVNTPLAAPDTSVLPATLVLPARPTPTPTPGLAPRDIVLKENIDPVTLQPVEVKLNGRAFTDPVEDFVKAGTTETWNFINLTVDAHPMHTHLVQFKVVSRQAINVAAYTLDWYNWLAAGRQAAIKPVLTNYLMGKPTLPAPEETGWKDTVKAYPGTVTTVVASFTLPSNAVLNPVTNSYGKYVYHCHILEHEENDMMRPYEVVP